MFSREFSNCVRDIRNSLTTIDGWLTDREVSFLAIAAAHPTASGDILEIGSFRGRSTVVLAKAKRLAKPSQLIAVDPLPNEDPMARDEHGVLSARALFDSNLRDAGVANDVEFHQAYSFDIAGEWKRPLRLLWIDGDHSYSSTKQDYDLFQPHVSNGGILAMHDVLSPYDGCIRVFTEEVLRSPHFGAVGLCGSIGWAQYWSDPADAEFYAKPKRELLEQLLPLVDYHCQTESPRGLAKLRYKLLRAKVPHRRIKPQQWIRSVRTDLVSTA